MKRIYELFTPQQGISPISRGRIPRRLCAQKHDWTCAIACIRTMMSCFTNDLPSESALLETCDISPGPLFSRDLKALGILEGWDTIYGCDDPQPSMDKVVTLLDEGYSVMLESMYNCTHWMVLLGVFVLGDGSTAETDQLLCYDPYYHQVRLINSDEFLSMWQDGYHATNGIRNDYLAIRPLKEI